MHFATRNTDKTILDAGSENLKQREIRCIGRLKAMSQPSLPTFLTAAFQCKGFTVRTQAQNVHHLCLDIQSSIVRLLRYENRTGDHRDNHNSVSVSEQTRLGLGLRVGVCRDPFKGTLS